MRPRFLADEDFNAKIISGLVRREPSLDIQTAKAAGVLGLSDFEVLSIAAREGRILISHDRHTMPIHFRRFVLQHSSPGVLVLSQELPLREAIEQLLTVWAASEPEEWINRLEFLPF